MDLTLHALPFFGGQDPKGFENNQINMTWKEPLIMLSGAHDRIQRSDGHASVSENKPLIHCFCSYDTILLVGELTPSRGFPRNLWDDAMLSSKMHWDSCKIRFPLPKEISSENWILQQNETVPILYRCVWNWAVTSHVYHTKNLKIFSLRC